MIFGKQDGQVWRLSYPIILSNLFVPLPGAVDTAVLGHLDSEAYIGSVAINAMIFSFIYWGFGFLRMGTTGPAAQAWGADNRVEFWAVLQRGLLLAAFFSTCLFLLQAPISDLAFWLVETSPQVEGYAEVYFDIRIWGSPATLANYVLIGWFLGAQDSKTPMILLIVVNLLNVVLDLFFVLVLDLKVDGVAAATVIAEYAGLLLGLYYMVRRQDLKSDQPFDWARVLDMDRLKRMMLVNRDILIRTICLVFAMAYFTAQGAKLGDDILAANFILINFQYFTAYGLDGFAHATESLVGRAVGRGNADEVKDTVRSALRLGAVMSIGVALIYAVGGGVIIAIFTDLQEIADLAGTYLIWVVLLPVLSVWCFVYDGVFLGATRSAELRNGMVISLISFLIVLHGTEPFLGNHGLWLAMCALMVVRGLTLWHRFPRVIQDATKAG